MNMEKHKKVNMTYFNKEKHEKVEKNNTIMKTVVSRMYYTIKTQELLY